MLSKLLRPARRHAVALLVCRTPGLVVVRSAQMIPPTQYDMAFPKRLKLGYALSHYWELIPLFTVTCVSLGTMVFSIFWAFGNKVDGNYCPHSRNTISRTMNLRHPTVHKLIIINQRYPPWPEMQDALDKISAAERKQNLAMTGECE